jgi:hypothetical protein
MKKQQLPSNLRILQDLAENRIPKFGELVEGLPAPPEALTAMYIIDFSS